MTTDREPRRDFSERYPGAAFSSDIRGKKARTILAVLEDFLNADLKGLKLLDLGSSAGMVSHRLADRFKRVVGVDVDRGAVDFARQHFKKANLDFALADGMNLAFLDGIFDVVICNHIYEHVPDAGTLLDEISRVLRPGGVCYFGADNRLCVWEPHHRLPFLSWLPGPVSNFYLRLSGRGRVYEEKLLSCRGLRALVTKFSIIDYTRKIIENPSLFCANYMLEAGSFRYKMANLVVRYAYPLCPGYIWLLQKIEGSGSQDGLRSVH